MTGELSPLSEFRNMAFVRVHGSPRGPAVPISGVRIFSRPRSTVRIPSAPVDNHFIGIGNKVGHYLVIILLLYSNVVVGSGKALCTISNCIVMRKPGEWMQPLDDRILEVLDSSGLVLTPAVIAYNLEKSRGAVSRRLSELAEYGLVDRVERGKYEITDRGAAYLAGQFDASLPKD